MGTRCFGSFGPVEFFPICSPAVLGKEGLYSCLGLEVSTGNISWKALNSSLGATVGPHDSQDRVGEEAGTGDSHTEHPLSVSIEEINYNSKRFAGSPLGQALC